MASSHRADGHTPKKIHELDEMVAKVRQVDVMVSQGQTTADAIRSIGVTEATNDRWYKEIAGHACLSSRLLQRELGKAFS